MSLSLGVGGVTRLLSCAESLWTGTGTRPPSLAKFFVAKIQLCVSHGGEGKEKVNELAESPWDTPWVMGDCSFPVSPD